MRSAMATLATALATARRLASTTLAATRSAGPVARRWQVRVARVAALLLDELVELRLQDSDHRLELGDPHSSPAQLRFQAGVHGLQLGHSPCELALIVGARVAHRPF